MAGPPLSYAAFRTGLTYADVYQLIWSRPHKGRHGVLGAWRENKQLMYAEYLRQWRHGDASYTPTADPIPD